MARKPRNFEWVGFTAEQIGLLNRLDFYGNNGWARNSQSETLLPILLRYCAEADLEIERVIGAMDVIGYSREALHQLERWEAKRTTGKFGK